MNKFVKVRKTHEKIQEVKDYLEEHFGLKKNLHSKLFLAGGAVYCMEFGEKINDYDFYFNSRGYADKFLEELKEKIASDLKCEDDVLVGTDDIIINESAITIKSLKVQLVVRFAGAPMEVINRFDYAHSQCYIMGSDVYISPLAYKSKALNKLMYTGSEYPLSALFRLRKFLARGWKIDVNQIAKIAFELNQLNLNDMDTLCNQLIGVDLLLFQYAIEALKKVDTLSVSTVFDVLDETFE